MAPLILIAQQTVQTWIVASAPYLSIIKDIIVASCSLIAVSIAWRGLNTWKRQLSGNSRHELARRWILSAYKLRDAIESVRKPGMSSGEVQNALVQSGRSLEGLDPKAAHMAQMNAVYFVRWNKVLEAKSELLVNSLEAEVLWGAEAKAAYLEVGRSVQKLWAAIVVDLDLKDTGQMELDHADAMKRMRIMFPAAATPEEDEYMVELNAAVGKVEKIGKPHLITE